jgi:hypothetical protein
MTDTSNAPQIPVLPEATTIPFAMVQKWMDLSDTQYVDFKLTRTDLDHLFKTIDKQHRATYLLQAALLNFTNGDLESANKNFVESQRHLIESQNALRNFFMAIMAQAQR